MTRSKINCLLVLLVLAAGLSFGLALAQGPQSVTITQPAQPTTVGAAVPTSASLVAAEAPALPIAAGDLLDVQVFDTPELSGKLRVDNHGEVTLPVGGTLRVEHQTAEQAATAVEARLRQQDILKDPHVNVFVLEYATQGVTVLGEVKNPGIYPLLGPHTLFDLISAAGGATPTAGKAVSITHRVDPTHHEMVEMSNDPALAAKANLPIKPGDTIVVSKAGVVYVVGDVAKPGGFLIENNDRLTVLQALALAQGTNRTAKLNKSRLIRKTGAARQESKLELKKILADKAPDPKLQDGDIIFVPSSEGKNMLYRGLEATVGLATGVVIYGRY